MNSAVVDAAAAPPSASPLTLALIFGRISSTAFGGGQMGAIRREVVRRNKWMSEAEYLELLSIASIAPGPNPVSMAVLVGKRLGGIPGAIAALLGCTVPGFVILMVLAILALDPRMTILRAGLRGAAAAALGLTLASTIEMTVPFRRQYLALAFVVAAALAVTLLHVSLFLTLLVLVPLGVATVGRRAAA